MTSLKAERETCKNREGEKCTGEFFWFEGENPYRSQSQFFRNGLWVDSFFVFCRARRGMRLTGEGSPSTSGRRWYDWGERGWGLF